MPTRVVDPLLKFVVLLTLSVSLLCAGSASAGAPLEPVEARDPAGLIAFVNEQGLIALVDPETSEVTTYGEGRQQAVFPAWSSSGAVIAYVVARPSGTSVEVIDVSAGTAPESVYAAPDRGPIYLNWSPDDRHLAVLSSTPGAELALDILDVDRALAHEPDAMVNLANGQPLYWVWSDTGRSLLLHLDVLRPDAMVGMSPIDAFAVERPLLGPGAFQAPDISDSGEFLVYAARDAEGGRVVVTRNPEHGGAGGAVIRLEHEGMVAFAWRPGHDQLSVQGATSAGFFTGSLELVDVPSGETRLLTPTTVLASFWSPDGRWLATLSGDSDDGQVAGVDAAISHVQGRPPLLNLEFIEVDSLTRVDAGAFRPTPAFASQYLPFFDQYSRSHSLWSPASDALVLPTVGPGGAAELVIFGTDGAIRELVRGDMPAWNVR